MDNVNYAICDDEEIILEAVYDRVSTLFKRSGLSAMGAKFHDPVELKDRILKKSAQALDLVFLDIDMPGLDGIELGKIIKENSPNTEIIFVSNRYEKVFDTFDIHPFGFVRKNNFSTDIGNAIKAYINARGSAKSYFVVQQENNSVTRKLPVNDIVYVESMKNHQMINMVNGEVVDVRMTMDDLEQKLAEHDILRVHKGYLVNLRYITRIEPSGIELSTGVNVSVSRRRISEIKTELLKYLRKTGALIFD